MLTNIISQITSKFQEELPDLEVWFFDHFKEYALELYRNYGWITIPATLQKGKGKIQKKPLIPWKDLEISNDIELEQIWEKAVADRKYLGRRELGITTRKLKIEEKATAIALLTGQKSGVSVLDIDDPKKFREKLEISEEQWEELIKTNLVVKTPSGGLHIYFVYEPKLKTTTSQGYGFDIRNDGGLVIIPPSRLPDEKQPAYEVINDENLKEVPEYLLKKLIQVLKKTVSLKPKKNSQISASKGLSEGQIKEIVDLFVPIWKPGHRHNLTLYLTGTLYKSGIPLETAREIIKKIVQIAGDEEEEHRLYIVDYTYNERSRELKEEGKELKGITGIEEELHQLVEEGFISESGAYHILERLQTFLKPNENEKGSFFVLTQYDPPKGYANIWKKKTIVEWKRKKDGTFTFTKKILNACITDIEVIYDPEIGERLFKVLFEPPTGKPISLIGTHQEILGQILSLGLHCVEKNKVDIALASILTALETKGVARVKEQPKFKGFFYYDNRLIANWDFLDFVEKLSEEEVEEKIKIALKLLDTHITFWGEKKKNELVEVVKYALTSPFFYIRKRISNRPFRWLFVIGQKDTGKTEDAKLTARFWGVEERLLTKSEITRIPSFTRAISQSTFAVIADETATLFPKNREDGNIGEVSEYLRKIWGSPEARKILKNHVVVRYLALSPLIFTANRTPHLLPPERKRIKVIEYPLSAMATEEDKIAFGIFLEEAEEKYPFIGYAVYKLISEDPLLIKKFNTFEEFGEFLLTEVYKRYYGSIPDWVSLRAKEVVETKENETESEAIDIMLNILAGLIDFIRFKSRSDYGVRHCLRESGNVDCIVKYCVEADISAPVASYSPQNSYENEKYLALSAGILQILNERGIEISTLKTLAQILKPLGAKYQKVSIRQRGWIGKRCVLIPYPQVNELLSVYYQPKGGKEADLKMNDDIDLNLEL
jgi:ABC-type cobalt transport system substrate-binding protein